MSGHNDRDSQRSRRWSWPISRLLVLFVVIQALPFIGLAAFDIVRIASSEREAFKESLNDKAEEIRAGLDRILDGYIVRLNTLASSPALQTINLQQAHAQAKAALEPDGLVAFYRNLQGDQLFNTRIEYGSALPRRPLPLPSQLVDPLRPSPIPLPRLLAHISAVVDSPVAGRRIVEVSVPVMNGAEAQGVLSLSIELARFDDVLRALRQEHSIPYDWQTKIRDQRYDQLVSEVVDQLELPARRREPGITQSKAVVGWEISVWAPRSVIGERVQKALLLYLPVVLSAALLGLAGVWWIGQLISRPITDAAKAASALGAGRAITIAPSIVQEADEVNRALMLAAEHRRAAEASLRERQEQLNAARLAAGVATFRFDVTTDQIVWSDHAEYLFGVPAEVITTGAGFFGNLHPAEHSRAEEKRRIAFATGGPFQTEPFRFVALDGVDRWIILRGRVDLDAMGRPIAVVGACVDITARKLEEGHARRWQSVFEDADFGLAHVSATDDTFIEVNRAFARERGFLPQELRRQSLLEGVTEAAREATRENMRCIGLAGHRGFESEFIRKDGTTFPVFMEVTIIRDDAGEPISRVVYARDITDLKRAEGQLRDHQKALHHRLQNLLSVTREVALQSAQSLLPEAEMARFEQALAPRLDALSGLHDLLLGRPHQAVAVTDLVWSILGPFLDDNRRLEADGPDLFLKRPVAQDLGLALHELATNTTKYGALSRRSPSGLVRVNWRVWTGANGTSEFELIWQERGGPAVATPRRKGFGYAMLTEMMDHHGRARLSFASPGVEWNFTAPAEDTVHSAAGSMEEVLASAKQSPL